MKIQKAREISGLPSERVIPLPPIDLIKALWAMGRTIDAIEHACQLRGPDETAALVLSILNGEST